MAVKDSFHSSTRRAVITAPAAGCPVTPSVTVPVTMHAAGSVTTTSAGSALALAVVSG